MEIELRNKILNLASEQFLKYGFRSVTMDDIAKHSGVSKKTVYQYFESKETLVEETVKSFEAQMHHQMCTQLEAEDAIQQMVKIYRVLIRNIRQISHSTMYDLQKYYLPIWTKLEAMRLEMVTTLIIDNITRGKQEGLYREDLNEEIIAKLYFHKSELMASEEIFSRETYQRDQLFLQFVSYHIHGIASPKGIKRWDELKDKIL